MIAGEAVKLLCAAVLLFQAPVQPGEFDLLEVLKSGVPSILYVIVNNLAFVAISNLDAAAYQLTYQGKIFTTAVLSVLILKRKLSVRKWLALGVLGCGIAMVQLGDVSFGSSDKSTVQVQFGLAAAATGCTLSSLAVCPNPGLMQNLNPAM